MTAITTPVEISVYGGSEKQNAWAARIQKSALPHLVALAPGFVHGVKDPSSSAHENAYAMPRDARFWINAFKNADRELPKIAKALENLKEAVNVDSTGLVYNTEDDKVYLVVLGNPKAILGFKVYLIDGTGGIAYEADATTEGEAEGLVEHKLGNYSRRNVVFLASLKGYASEGVAEAVRNFHTEAVRPSAGESSNWKRYYNYGSGGRTLRHAATTKRKY